jgi:hypothetical protein
MILSLCKSGHPRIGMGTLHSLISEQVDPLTARDTIEQLDQFVMGCDQWAVIIIEVSVSVVSY